MGLFSGFKNIMHRRFIHLGCTKYRKSSESSALCTRVGPSAKGDGNLTSGENSIPLANVKMHKDTIGSAISLSTTYQNIPRLTNQDEGTDIALAFKLWITVPDSQPLDDYVFILYIQITESS